MPFATFIFMALCCVLLPGAGFAGVQLYTGTIEIVTVSGNACGGVPGTHAVSLFLRRDHGSSAVSGFLEGPAVTTGKFSGMDPTRLDVRYPYHDDLRAGGHFLSMTNSPDGLTAELRDRHLGSSDDDCNFDLARLHLKPAGSGEAVEARLKRVAALFEAQLIRSEAYDLARTGRYEAALPLYEKALALADPAAGGNADQITPYIIGLANAYVKLGRSEQFSRLYDERIGSIKDEGAKTTFSGHRIRFLLQSGRTAMAAEDYPAALENLRKAYLLQPHSIETIAAVMMVQLRMGEHDGAIVFLEEALKSMENSDGVRPDLRAALAQVYFLRAKKYDLNGLYAEAEADLKKGDELDPYSVQYLVARARLRHKRGSLDDAERLLQQGLERFQYEPSRREITAARDRMRMTEVFLKKLRTTVN